MNNGRRARAHARLPNASSDAVSERDASVASQIKVTLAGAGAWDGSGDASRDTPREAE